MFIIRRRLPLLLSLSLIAIPTTQPATKRVAAAFTHRPAALWAAASGLSYSVSPASGPAPLTVTFDASNNPDASKSEYRWGFPDGTSAFGTRVTRTFYQPGKYQVTLEVTLPGGGRARGSTTITAEDNGPERARMLVLADTTTDFTFDARSSVIYSPDATFTWDFGDGSTASGPTATHSFKNGSSIVRLKASSNGKELSEAIELKPTVLARNTSFEARVLELTNTARTRGWDCTSKNNTGRGTLPPLKRNPLLDRAARAQSAGMALAGYFDHVSALDGSHPSERVTAAGYAWRATGENIAAGQETPDEVVDQWLRSSGHCHNIMSPDFSEIGIALVQGGTGSRPYWTQVFASPR